MCARTRAQLAALFFLFLFPAAGATIFQSATLGSSVGFGNGVVVSGGQFLGVRFQLTSTYDITAVGGHFDSSLSGGSGTIFAAIVSLSGPTAFPDLPSNFVPLASTTLAGTNPSSDIRSALTITLGPGYYALIFGSSRFGAAGNADAAGDDTDVGSPSYFVGVGSSPGSWQNGGFASTRFVVEGNLSSTVPEPSSAALLVAGLGLVLVQLRRRG